MSDPHRLQQVGPDRRRRRAWTAAAAIALTVAVSVPALGMTNTSPAPSATAAAPCSSVTVPGFDPDAPDQTWTVKLIGSARCSRAHRLVRSYFRRVVDGDCVDHGNRCILTFPGGWTCSIITAGESELIGGAAAGCARGNPLRAAIRLFPAGTRPAKVQLERFLSPNLRVSCVIAGIETACVAVGKRSRGSDPARYWAIVDTRGQVTTCRAPQPRRVCLLRFIPAVPLVAGQQSEAWSGRCTATRNGIRCIRTKGPGAGNGFFVSPTTVRKIRPASAAQSRAASTTASGTMLSVSSQLQVVSQSNPDGSVTECGILGGSLRTATGTINFAAGGVLTSQHTLEPGPQALVDTIQEASRRGSTAVATITYDDSRTLCGYALTNFVTRASFVAAPPPPPPAPPPPPSILPPGPEPTTQTASGIVTRMSAFGQLVLGSSYCEIWPGIFKPDAGPLVRFAVQSPLAGNLDTGLNPTDPEAFPRAEMLQRAALIGAPVTMTYTGPVRVCGYPLEAVVTAATADFPSQYEVKPKVTKRGRVTRMSRPSVVSGYGSSCRIWRGSLRTRAGVRWGFSVETELTGSPAHAADRRALKIARTLRRAKRRRSVTTITFAGPVIACGKRLSHVVTRASTRRLAVRARRPG